MWIDEGSGNMTTALENLILFVEFLQPPSPSGHEEFMAVFCEYFQGLQ